MGDNRSRSITRRSADNERWRRRRGERKSNLHRYPFPATEFELSLQAAAANMHPGHGFPYESAMRRAEVAANYSRHQHQQQQMQQQQHESEAAAESVEEGQLLLQQSLEQQVSLEKSTVLLSSALLLS